MAEIMDNFYMKVRAESKEALRAAIGICLGRRNPVGYQINRAGLILFWTKTADMKPFPFPESADSVHEFVWRWLASLTHDEFDRYAANKYDDGDVDNDRGFEVYTDEKWGHAGGRYEACCAIKPSWAWVGK